MSLFISPLHNTLPALTLIACALPLTAQAWPWSRTAEAPLSVGITCQIYQNEKRIREDLPEDFPLIQVGPTPSSYTFGSSYRIQSLSYEEDHEWVLISAQSPQDGLHSPSPDQTPNTIRLTVSQGSFEEYVSEMRSCLTCMEVRFNHVLFEQEYPARTGFNVEFAIPSQNLRIHCKETYRTRN